ncbi:hypothetical protein [Cupriavidus sp. RAF12]|uniref:hypothetical protein n=1 Tax=Cupriavidus sp. RAF12 TaxID=3233050 RepID=UPI003F900CD6
MSKSIVETTGSFELVEPNQSVPYNRPAVVEQTHFLTVRQELGQVRVLAVGLDKEATDVEFAQYLKDSEDQTLAIAAFAEKYQGTVYGDSQPSAASTVAELTPAQKRAAARTAAPKSDTPPATDTPPPTDAGTQDGAA